MNNTAYILQKKNYHESGSVITLLTKEYGKINALLRGSRNKSSTNLELFNQFSVVLQENIASKKTYLNSPAQPTYETLFFIQEIIPQKTCQLEKDSLWLAFYMNELLCLPLNNHTPPQLIKPHKTLTN